MNFLNPVLTLYIKRTFTPYCVFAYSVIAYTTVVKGFF